MSLLPTTAINVNKTRGSIEREAGSLRYTRLGTGTKALLAFHGFGQRGHDLMGVAEVLTAEYTVYVFDLFYHGDSTWHDSHQPLSKSEWSAWVRAFLVQEGLPAFAVLGFSLGGRLALATVEAFPERVTGLLLLAPDGLAPNFWYHIATHNRWAQGLFQKVALKPGLFQQLVVGARTLRLLHPKLIRFAQSQLATTQQRQRLYCTWILFRQLRFRSATLIRLLNEQPIPIQIFVGKYDQVLPARQLRPWLRHLHQCQLTELETGHGQLLTQAAHYLRQNPTVLMRLAKRV